MIKRFFRTHFTFSCILRGLSGLIFIAAMLLGCEDEPYQVGLQLLPEQDDIDVSQVDTLTIETFTIGPEGIPVSDSLNLPFGTYNQEVFGQTRASLMLEFSPAGYYKKINPGVVIDTVIMDIYYDTIYDDQSYLPQIEVFKLTEGFDKSTRYYSDYDKAGKYDPDNLAISETYKPDTTKTLSLLLDENLGYDILGIGELNDSIMFTSYKIDSAFDAQFKGLYLNPIAEPDDEGLLNIRSVRMTVKFRTDIDTTSIIFAFLPEDTRYLNVNGERVWLGDKYIKIFEHDYTGSAIEHLNDSAFQDTIIYLQSLGGTQAVLKFPELEQLRQSIGQVSVNHAELIIPALDDSLDLVRRFYPTQLGLRVLNDADPYVPDDVMIQSSQFVSPVSYMNGRFNNIIWAYRFNLTAYFHEYFKGNISSSRLLLFAGKLDVNIRRTNFNAANYNSVILAGSTSSNNRITLRVAFTKL